jgi:predicted enzyme related to lactoylglutathione lyase
MRSFVFDSLDFLYVPAPEIDPALRFYCDQLGAKLRWKIHAMGAWVACVQLSTEGPPLLLADHKEQTGPQLVYRVASLDRALEELKARGWTPEGPPFEIPNGPCCALHDPAGNTLAIYENKRPGAAASFDGRIDPG